MTVIQWQRVQEIFSQALSIPQQERPTFINKACGDDDELKGEVESLLHHHEQATNTFMAQPESNKQPIDSNDDDKIDSLIGKHVGQYKILSVIASGGMGTVYEAQQEKPKRIVALKITRSWMNSSSILKRFEFESQALARLNHPYIAQIFDAGIHKDHEANTRLPYFAMEFVQGAMPITKYADQNHLDMKQRQELMISVCEAVHHGHQKGIIHRDLKPGNILVDHQGCVKVIDFGIARSTDSDVAITTVQTDVGQLLGTLQYMSPEQCEADPLGIDTRSDIYSLGVVLYELLCGQLPYDVTRTTIAAAARVISEDIPVKPGTIQKALRDDLELILLKTLEKNRELRYQSASDLARDLQHNLNNEPIEARPPTIWSRSLRFAARHPILITTCASIFVAASIILGTFISLIWVTQTPQELVGTENFEQISLVSISGHVLHSWVADPPNSIRKGNYINTSADLGNRRLVVLAYGYDNNGPLRGSLVMYDIDQSYEKPIWTDKLHEEDIPFTTRKSGFSTGDFGVDKCDILEVFEENPGPEIIAFFSHLYSRRAMRIYSLDGKLLYQMWHDGVIQSYYMMRKAGLLVLACENAEVYWEDRGYPNIKERHPHVVFALRPKIELISNKYLKTERGDSDLHPVWYHCVLPPLTTDVFINPSVTVPKISSFDDGSHVMFQLIYRGYAPNGINFIIDQFGNVIPDAHVYSDEYNRNLNIPRAEQFYLGPLPPIIDKEINDSD